MPFGLQVSAASAANGEVLGAAHAMEGFKRIPASPGPLPAIARLRKPVAELKSIVTHPPQAQCQADEGAGARWRCRGIPRATPPRQKTDWPASG